MGGCEAILVAPWNENTCRDLGGVRRVVRHGNLKAAAVRACLYDPDVNEVDLAFARHWGFTHDRVLMLAGWRRANPGRHGQHPHTDRREGHVPHAREVRAQPVTLTLQINRDHLYGGGVSIKCQTQYTRPEISAYEIDCDEKLVKTKNWKYKLGSDCNFRCPSRLQKAAV